jgi:hypothetical protein
VFYDSELRLYKGKELVTHHRPQNAGNFRRPRPRARLLSSLMLVVEEVAESKDEKKENQRN